MSDQQPKTIKQVMRFRANHGIDPRVIDSLSDVGAQAFVNMSTDQQIGLMEARFCPETGDPTLYIVEPGNLSTLINSLLEHLGALNYTKQEAPQIVNVSAAGQFAGFQQVATPLQVVSNPYADLILGRITPQEAELLGVKFYMKPKKMYGLGGIVKSYVTLAARTDEQLSKNAEGILTMMQALDVDPQVQNDFYSWLKKARFNPHTHANAWFQESELDTMFDQLQGIFGQSWVEFMKTVGTYADTMGASGMFGDIARVEVGSMPAGLGRLNQSMGLMASSMLRATGGTLIPSAGPAIEMDEGLFKALNHPDVYKIGGSKTGRKEQILEFLTIVSGGKFSPVPWLLGETLRGLVYGLAATPTDFGAAVPLDLIKGFGEGAMQYSVLYEAALREAGIHPAATFRPMQPLANAQPASSQQQTTATGWRFTFKLDLSITR